MNQYSAEYRDHALLWCNITPCVFCIFRRKTALKLPYLTGLNRNRQSLPTARVSTSSSSRRSSIRVNSGN